MKAYRIAQKGSRKGIDRFCLSDGKRVRAGYSTARFRRKLGPPRAATAATRR